jgi:hypothetical protein
MDSSLDRPVYVVDNPPYIKKEDSITDDPSFWVNIVCSIFLGGLAPIAVIYLIVSLIDEKKDKRMILYKCCKYYNIFVGSIFLCWLFICIILIGIMPIAKI